MSGADRLLGRYPSSMQLALNPSRSATTSVARGAAARPRGRPGCPPAGRRGPCAAGDGVGAGRPAAEHEREELGVGLGDIERALDVALSPARVAEPVARDRADEQRLDEGARVQHGRGAVQHRTEGLRLPCRRSPRPSRRRRAVRLAPLALLVREPGQDRRASAVRPRRSSVEPLAHLRREGVRRQEQALQPLGAREAASAASGGPGRARACPRALDQERRGGLEVWSEQRVGALEPGVRARSGLARASISPSIARATQRIGWVDRPRASAALIACAHRSRTARRSATRRSREVAQAPDLDVRESDLRASASPCSRCRPASSRRWAQSSTMPRFINAGPGLRAQAHLAQGRPPRAAERLHPLEHGAEVAGGARQRQARDGEHDLEALPIGARRRSACLGQRQVRRRPLERALGHLRYPKSSASLRTGRGLGRNGDQRATSRAAP